MSTHLKLKAETQADLQIISASMQDAIVRVGGIDYNPKGRFLTLRATRFRHEDQQSARIQSGLRLDGILSLSSRGLDRSDPDAMAVLLGIDYAEDDAPPGGVMTFIFAGGGEIRARVEALELILADVAEPRLTNKTPLHPDLGA